MALPQRRELISAAGQDLMHVALVARVEDDWVARRVEDPMHRESQLDDSEVRSEVATGLADVFDQEQPDFSAQLLQLIWRQVPQVLWATNRAQESVRGGRHGPEFTCSAALDHRSVA